MRSSFFEFNVAKTGLFTARSNLEITSHNVANAETHGYSRQYALQKANTPINLFNGQGMIGTGSSVYGIGQHRSFYLDKKYWSESPVLGEYRVKSTYLEIVEGVLNGASENGIKSYFDDFFKSLQDLKTTSGDDTYRINMLEVSQTLTKLVNTSAENLKKQQNDINSEVKSVVNIINSIGQQIKSLNKQIHTYELDGSKANDLRDERARLVDGLSNYVNISVEEKDNKFSVNINGYEFVNHVDAQVLTTVDRDSKRNPTDVPGLCDIYFEGSNLQFDIYHKNLKGELKGLIDLRDGNNSNLLGGQALETTNYKGVPHYLNKLNELVRTFARAVNEGVDASGNPIPNVIGHESGYDRDGNLGLPFFTNGGGTVVDYDLMTCENFAVNQVIIDDPKKIAAASDSTSDESDNRVILGFLNIPAYRSLFKEGKLEDYIVGVSSELGITKKQADNFYENYNDVLNTIDNQRIEVYGVDVNEEMMNLMKYNQLYQASAKLINIIDGIYDTCINRMGV
ncbi:MAG: flagellar hook-associated protein FlgK [Clostridiales bacterium]|jgi:flagellar hook-associated protein 1 FlgK|nr:flagellar hook-associated protein FlgK [Clostridiales bacterium]